MTHLDDHHPDTPADAHHVAADEQGSSTRPLVLKYPDLSAVICVALAASVAAGDRNHGQRADRIIRELDDAGMICTMTDLEPWKPADPDPAGRAMARSEYWAVKAESYLKVAHEPDRDEARTLAAARTCADLARMWAALSIAHRRSKR